MKSSLNTKFYENRAAIESAYLAILTAQRDADGIINQPNSSLPDDDFFKGAKGEVRRLAEAARLIPQFLNETPFYEPSEEKKRVNLELNPSIPEQALPVGFEDAPSTEKLDALIKLMREQYLLLLRLQRQVMNPYVKEPPRWWTRPIVRRVIAAVALVVILIVAGYFAWDRLVDRAYERGVAALNRAKSQTTATASDEAAWADAINELTFAYNDFRKPYKDSAARLAESYAGGVEAYYSKNDWVNGHDLAVRYYQTHINPTDATLKLREGYFKPAQVAYANKEWEQARTYLAGLEAAFTNGVPASLATPDSTGTQAAVPTTLTTEEEQLYRDSYYADALEASQKEPPDWDKVTTLLSVLIKRPITVVPTFDAKALDLLTTGYTTRAKTILEDKKDEGRWDKARTLLEPILQAPLKVAGFHDRVWQTAYDLYLDTYYEPASSLLESKQYDAAREEFAKLVKLEQGDEYQSTHSRYREAFYQPAQALINEKKYTDARKLLDQLIALDSPAPAYLQSESLQRDTVYYPARAALEKGDYSTARAQFATLINYDKSGAVHRDSYQLLLSAYYLPAEQAVQNKQWQDALDLLTALYQIQPNYSNTVVLLTTTYYALGSDAVQHEDLPTAQQYLESLREINPGYTGLQSLLSGVYYQRAETLLGDKPQRKEWDAAREFLLLLHKFNPGYRDTGTLLRNSYYDPAQQVISMAHDQLAQLATVTDSTQQKTLVGQIQESTQSARLLLDKLNGPNSGNFILKIALTGQPTQTMTGTLTDNNPTESYSVFAKQDAQLTLTLTDAGPVSGLDLLIELQSAQGRTLASNDDAADSSVGSLNAQIKDFAVSANNTYTILVKRYTPSQQSSNEEAGLVNYNDAQTLLHESYYVDIKAAIAVNNLDLARNSIEELSALSPYYKDTPSLFNLTFYDPAVKAMAAKDWLTARDLLSRLLALEPYYRDAFTLLRESYYRPAQQALQDGRWDDARAALMPLLLGGISTRAIDPQYKDARELFKESYYRPALQAYDAQQWDASDKDLLGLQAALEQLDHLTGAAANYGTAPKDLQTMLREVDYEPALKALDAQDWTTAQDKLHKLISRIASLEGIASDKADWGTTPNNAQTLIREAYYRPAIANLKTQNWVSARDDLEGLLNTIVALEGVDRGKANYQVAPDDAQTLLRETYYQPAVIALKAEDWQTARHELASLLDLIGTLEPKTPDAPNYGAAPNDAQTLLRQAYLLPGEAALKSQDWPVAQQTFQDLVKIDPTYNNLLIIAYLTPGQVALNNHDWGLARENFQYVIRELAPSGKDADQSQISKAKQLLRESYFQPANTAYNLQDWDIARQNLAPLIQAVPPDQEALDLNKKTYLTPVQNAINTGDSEVARKVLLDFSRAYPDETQTYHDLLLQTYSIPLQEAVKRQDWFSATEQLLGLRNKHVQDKLINLILLEAPELNETLAGRFASYWTQVALSPNSALIFQRHSGAVNSLAIVGTRLITGGSDGSIIVWDSGFTTPSFAIQTGQAWVSTIVADSRGGWIASIGKNPVINIWDGEGGQLISTLNGHESRINALAASQDGQWLASGSEDKSVRLWKSSDWTTVPIVLTNSDRVTALQFAPDGKLLAAALANGDVILWDLATNAVRTTIKTNSFIRKVIFSPDGSTIVTVGNQPDVQIWSLNGDLLQTLKGHTDWIRSASFSGDGKLLATVSADNTLAVWNIETGKIVNTTALDTPYDVQFAKDSSLLVVGSGDGKIRQWSATPN